jgi:hypothetical protein
VNRDVSTSVARRLYRSWQGRVALVSRVVIRLVHKCSPNGSNAVLLACHLACSSLCVSRFSEDDWEIALWMPGPLLASSCPWTSLITAHCIRSNVANISVYSRYTKHTLCCPFGHCLLSKNTRHILPESMKRNTVGNKVRNIQACCWSQNSTGHQL